MIAIDGTTTNIYAGASGFLITHLPSNRVVDLDRMGFIRLVAFLSLASRVFIDEPSALEKFSAHHIAEWRKRGLCYFASSGALVIILPFEFGKSSRQRVILDIENINAAQISIDHELPKS